MDPGRKKAVEKAYRRYVAEIASATNVPSESADAHKLAFLMSAGIHQGMTGNNSVKVLVDEINKVIAANKRVAHPTKTPPEEASPTTTTEEPKAAG